MTDMAEQDMFSKIDRRKILTGGSSLLLGATLSMIDAHTSRAQAYVERGITISNMHTGENFSDVYWKDGRYLPTAFRQINHVMRDHRQNEIFPIDPRLMDIIYALWWRSGARQGYEVLSGYRTPKTNAMLRRRSKGVAKNSLHMYGQAVDIRLPGVGLKTLRNQALNLKAGGVGYYPKSHFVHIDTGRVRHWYG